MDVVIERLEEDPRDSLVEFVECKGRGHPDTICDLVCEEAGRALAGFYKKKFGRVLHYNIDKALLVAGESRPAWKGGRVIRPAKLIIAGRATANVGNVPICVERIISQSARQTLSRFKQARIDVQVITAQGSENLTQIFGERKRQATVANDTSFGCAHYPQTRIELLVLAMRDFLYSSRFRKHYPQVGDDIKIMVSRYGKKKEATLAIAFIDKHFSEVKQYKRVKRKLELLLSKKFHLPVKMNTLDDYKSEERGVYLTVTGLSCEMGDDGQVGRGNRYDGLITPNHAMSLEAVAGKNDHHPGRAYQIAAYAIATAVVKKCGAKFASVKMLTNIGALLNNPKIVSISVVGNMDKKRIETAVAQIVKDI